MSQDGMALKALLTATLAAGAGIAYWALFVLDVEGKQQQQQQNHGPETEAFSSASSPLNTTGEGIVGAGYSTRGQCRIAGVAIPDMEAVSPAGSGGGKRSHNDKEQEAREQEQALRCVVPRALRCVLFEQSVAAQAPPSRGAARLNAGCDW